MIRIFIYKHPHAGAGMRGGVVVFHGCGLKGEFFFGCGLKGEFFFGCGLSQILYDHNLY
jgi:hypothetical protein